MMTTMMMTVNCSWWLWLETKIMMGAIITTIIIVMITTTKMTSERQDTKNIVVKWKTNSYFHLLSVLFLEQKIVP